MAPLTEQIVLAELAVINNFYLPRKTAGEIETLAAIYYQDCIHLTAEDFVSAMAIHRKTSRFFPMPAEILDHARDIAAERGRNIKQLEEPELTDEQIKLNKQKIREFRRKMKIKKVPNVKNANILGERYPDLKTSHAAKVKKQAQKILQDANGKI